MRVSESIESFAVSRPTFLLISPAMFFDRRSNSGLSSDRTFAAGIATSRTSCEATMFTGHIPIPFGMASANDSPGMKRSTIIGPESRGISA